MNDAANRIWEQALVLRCQAGDDRAFAELVGTFHERLHYYVSRLAPHQVDIDDILQHVWMEVYCKLPKLKSPKAFRVWIYRIARDRVYSGYRHRRKAVQEYQNHRAAQDFNDEPSLPAEEAEDIRRVHISLQKLSPEHRDILMLRFMENMTYGEIASYINCQLGTVRSRLYHAKRALRHEMEKMNHDNG